MFAGIEYLLRQDRKVKGMKLVAHRLAAGRSDVSIGGRQRMDGLVVCSYLPIQPRFALRVPVP